MTQESVKIAERKHTGTAQSIIQELAWLVGQTPEKDADIVYVQIAPLLTYDGGTKEQDTIELFEETLSDGSKVYNIELC